MDIRQNTLTRVTVGFITVVAPASAGAWTMVQDLERADASYVGEADEDYAGSDVEIVGDVNGDGYDDLMIEARYNDEGGEGAGQVYLVLGHGVSWSTDVSLAEVDASFVGESGNWGNQSDIEAVGDVNGDGYADVLISAPYNYGMTYGTGEVYLVMGRPSGWAMDTPIGDVDASFWGEEMHDHAGGGLAGIGDADQDGFDDFAIGASGSGACAISAGKVYVIHGHSEDWAMHTPLAQAGAWFCGETLEGAGEEITGPGDLNGDGLPDLVVGAPDTERVVNRAGAAVIVFGIPGGWRGGESLDTAPSFVGERDSERIGLHLSGAGDVNGDGYDDLLIGSPSDVEVPPFVGKVHLVLGGSVGWAPDTPISAADASFRGAAIYDRAGDAIGSAGDLDGDGYDDVIVGVSTNDHAGGSAGQVYLLFGGIQGWTDSTLSDASSASLVGFEARLQAGTSVAGGGDLDGDGRPDLAIGAAQKGEL